MSNHSNEPDYDFWDSIDPLTILDACFLWHEAEPTKNSQHFTPKMEAIERSIVYHINRVEYVYRCELIELAHRLGVRPKFLFPEKRQVLKKGLIFDGLFTSQTESQPLPEKPSLVEFIALQEDRDKECAARIEAERKLVEAERKLVEPESVRAERNALQAGLIQPPPSTQIHANERKALLAIIRALAELQDVKPIPTREDGDGWRKAAIALQSQFAHKGIKSPVNDKTLAKHLRNAFSDKDF